VARTDLSPVTWATIMPALAGKAMKILDPWSAPSTRTRKFMNNFPVEYVDRISTSLYDPRPHSIPTDMRHTFHIGAPPLGEINVACTELSLLRAKNRISGYAILVPILRDTINFCQQERAQTISLTEQDTTFLNKHGKRMKPLGKYMWVCKGLDLPMEAL
jgi:hypothetical protein